MCEPALPKEVFVAWSEEPAHNDDENYLIAGESAGEFLDEADTTRRVGRYQLVEEVDVTLRTETKPVSQED